MERNSYIDEADAVFVHLCNWNKTHPETIVVGCTVKNMRRRCSECLENPCLIEGTEGILNSHGLCDACDIELEKELDDLEYLQLDVV
jgi:hypothetical protein